MASTPADVKTYIYQWVKTATAGAVSVDFAWFEDRVQFRCHKCGAIYRCTTPQKVDEIDWNIMQWVKRHSPNGVHDKEEVKAPVAPIPLTADFKHSPGWTKPLIDESEENAAIIKAQMEKYKKEKEQIDLDEKAAFIKKIAAEKAKVEAEEDEKTKKIAMQNLLNIMLQLGLNESVLPALKPTPAAAPIIPEPPKSKPARIATGRRFR